MILALISTVWLAALVALVVLLATRPGCARAGMGAGAGMGMGMGVGVSAAERSPALLERARVSFEQAMGELLLATPVASSSKPATAEHVRDGAQEDLYVRP